MRTSKEFTANLKNNIITEGMLEAALFSVNKRAKNWRDKKREYKRSERRYGSFYDNSEKAERNETAMYQRKDTLLSLIKPVCIHKEFGGCKRTRVYDYEKGYDDEFVNYGFRGLIVWMNSYFDWDYGDETSFFDYEDPDQKVFRYYLFYRIGDHSFHTPITEADIKKYPEYKVCTIDTLDTHGEDTDELMSVQFVDKIIALINSGDFTYKAEEKEEKKEETGEEISKEFDEKDRFENAEYLWPEISAICLPRIKQDLSENLPEFTLSDDDKALVENDFSKMIEDKKSLSDNQRYFNKIKGMANLDRNFSFEFHAYLLHLCGPSPITKSVLASEYVKFFESSFEEMKSQFAKAKAKDQYFTTFRDRYLSEHPDYKTAKQLRREEKRRKNGEKRREKKKEIT